MKMKKYYEKKPDFENESFRCWKADKDEKMEDGYKVKINGQEVGLLGFTAVFNKKEHKLVFAYKFKHTVDNPQDNPMVLFAIPDELNEEDKKQIGELMKGFEGIVNSIGYQLVDLRETMKSVKMEEHNFKGGKR